MKENRPSRKGKEGEKHRGGTLPEISALKITPQHKVADVV